MTKAERTKRFIVEQVSPIFNKKGVYGTSLSDMTEATGLTKGAIYGNFKDKDSLAMACFDYNLRFLQKGLYKSLAKQGTAVDKLKALIEFYKEHFDQVAENGGCPLMNSAIEADDAYPLLNERVQNTLALWRKEVIGIILHSQENYEVERNAKAEDLAHTFIALMEGSIMIAKTMNDDAFFHQGMEVLERIVENELSLD